MGRKSLHREREVKIQKPKGSPREQTPLTPPVWKGLQILTSSLNSADYWTEFKKAKRQVKYCCSEYLPLAFVCMWLLVSLWFLHTRSGPESANLPCGDGRQRLCSALPWERHTALCGAAAHPSLHRLCVAGTEGSPHWGGVEIGEQIFAGGGARGGGPRYGDNAIS